MNDSRVSSETSLSQSPTQSTKRRRSNGDEEIRLEIVLGAVAALDAMFQDAPDELMRTYELGKVSKSLLPSRSAESEQEHKEFQAAWPTVFFANKSAETLERLRQLSHDEISKMNSFMKAAIHDAHEQDKLCIGTVIVDSTTGQVLARSSSERTLQSPAANDNPLATPTLLAIQAVSRLERTVATSHGIGSSTFQSGQYLCTGYDVYTTLEPTVFEAMALVHARIRRLVIGCRRNNSLGGLTDMTVHGLPGTNHKYRVFLCELESELAKDCILLRDATRRDMTGE